MNMTCLCPCIDSRSRSTEDQRLQSRRAEEDDTTEDGLESFVSLTHTLVLILVHTIVIATSPQVHHVNHHVKMTHATSPTEERKYRTNNKQLRKIVHTQTDVQNNADNYKCLHIQSICQ